MNFVQFAQAHGLIVDSIPALGRWVRVRTEDKPSHRNGAMKYMGDHGFVQNHATMQEVATWRAEGDHAAAQMIDPAIIERQRNEERARRIGGIRKAREMWADAKPLNRLHPYIDNKGLTAQGCSNLRQRDGFLYVPLWSAHGLLNIQTIHPDGTKRFVYGAPTKGCYFVIDRAGAALTALVEGLATGLAVYQNVRMARVIVAFNTGNLIPVIEALKPSGSVVMCGDDDHGTYAKRGFNPGKDAAANVADLIGCGVAYPPGIEGTDWADYIKEMGQGSGRQMERLILSKAKYVRASVP